MKNNPYARLITLQKKLESNILIASIRGGMIFAIPIFIIGSVGLIIQYFPVEAYQNFIATLWDGRLNDILNALHSATFGFITPILVVTIAYSYSKQVSELGQSDTSYPIIALASFLCISDFIPSKFDFSCFGAEGVFVGMLTSIIACFLYEKIKKLLAKKGQIRIFGADGLFNKVTANLLPFTIVFLGFGIFSVIMSLLGVDNIQESFSTLLCRIFGNKRSFGSGFLYAFLVALLWCFGIHGSNVFEAVALENFTTLNGSIFSKAFNDVFVIMGGSGTAICIVLAILIFGKNRRIRKTALSGLPMTIFNISETVIFGIPIILNPIFVIPFVLTPIVCYSTSYLFTYIGLMPVVTNEVIWTTPILYSGYVATGSLWGSAVQLLNIVLGVLIYGFFVRLNDKVFDSMYVDNVSLMMKKLMVAEERNEKVELLSTSANTNYSYMLAYDLYIAFKKKEFKLFYQPQIDSSGKCYGAEGLLRYKHKKCGFIPPPLILEMMKELGMLLEVEHYILETAIKFIKEKHYTGLLSVNVTADYLESEGFVDSVKELIERYGISTEYFAIEITEETAIVSKTKIVEAIEGLRELGVKIILDDFGMGHTSLLYIQNYKFDNVKITGDIVKGILTANKSKDIISSIVNLGRDLGFDVTAEFVETKEMRDILSNLGCQNFQGYYYSKALAEDDFVAYCVRNERRKDMSEEEAKALSTAIAESDVDTW